MNIVSCHACHNRAYVMIEHMSFAATRQREIEQDEVYPAGCLLVPRSLLQGGSWILIVVMQML